MTTPRDSSSSYQNGGGSFGRDFRLVFGAMMIAGDFVLVYFEHVAAKPPASYTVPDVVMHLALLIAGILLMDPRRTLELVSSLKDKIPVIGGK